MKLEQEARFMLTFALACLFVHLYGWLAAAVCFVVAGLGALAGAMLEERRKRKLQGQVGSLLKATLYRHAVERRKATAAAMSQPRKRTSADEVAH